ncbi:DUF4446 family protein [Clostridiales bacterium COT073_COT-073]|nr:DUF4446 family protein [Clostridiales bacterium COT073_COT-073]
MEKIWPWIEANQYLLLLACSVGCVLLLIVTLLQIKEQKNLKKKIKAYESGSLNDTLENKLTELQQELEKVKTELNEEKRKLLRVMAKEKKALKKVKLMKYNAFETQGGNVSYALALLNEENSGVVINSIHSTDFSFSYAKEVVKGRVNQVLSKEEEQILERAMEERERLSTR